MNNSTSSREIGPEVDFAPTQAPAREPVDGAYCRLEPVSAESHAEALFDAAAAPGGDDTWRYLPYGPFRTRAAFRDHLGAFAASTDPLFFTIINLDSGRPEGIASYLRIVPAMGVIEIGHIWLSPPLQQTRAATDAIYRMMDTAMTSLGNRRLEWKCNALNAASCGAASRLGFTFEGTFRQHMVVKGRNRDTAWYSILDHEWPSIRPKFEAWLAPGNFDDDGRQKVSLARS